MFLCCINRPAICNMVSFQSFATTVQKLAQFLGKDLTKKELDAVTHHCSFDQMKNNELTNRVGSDRAGVLDFQVSPFLRAGKCSGFVAF